MRKVFAKYDIWLEPSNRIGSIEKCKSLLSDVGFETIEIKAEQHGKYTSLAKAKATWEAVVTKPSSISLKIFPDLSQFSSAQLTAIKAEFEAELKAIQTEGGIWDDLTTLYVLGRKPVNIKS